MTSYAFKMKVTTVQTLGAHGTLMQWKYHYWYMYLASMYLDLTIFLASLEVYHSSSAGCLLCLVGPLHCDCT